MALKVEYLPIDALVPAERNARTHSLQQIGQLVAAIREFGWTNPILVDEERRVIAGHGRWEAARSMHMPEVPTITLIGLSEAQKRALALADNKLALNAGWDDDLLKIELGALVEMGFDPTLTGFDTMELTSLFSGGAAGLTDPDDAPAAEPDLVAQPGEVWLLGRHRLACGDCTVPATVSRLLRGVKPNLMVTDPPYGVQYDAAWRQRAGVGSAGAATGVVLNDDRADWRAAWTLFTGAVAYVWHAGTKVSDVALSLQATGFQLRAQIIWVKSRLALSRGDYHHQHEPCFYGVRDPAQEDWHFVPEHEVAAYAVRKGSKGDYVGGRKQSTVWFIEHLKSETGHSTQKPVDAMKRPIENNSKPGDWIYEPFSGSGTTIVAAEITGRSCMACELNPAYVDVAIRRWQNFTGQQATRESDGKRFEDVPARKGPGGTAAEQRPAAHSPSEGVGRGLRGRARGAKAEAGAGGPPVRAD